jgi:diguanylate cyclase (GGDEF)-like protein
MKNLEAAYIDENDSAIIQNGTPIRMFLAFVVSCILGIILMAATSRYLLMGVFIGMLALSVITAWLFEAGRIRIEAACLAPMLMLCFVYTPLSWFEFDGLLGCTPYLSILFATLITLTYYRRIQAIMITLYGALMLGLIVHWLATWTGEGDRVRIVNILVAYVLAITLTVYMAEAIKRKNFEINKRVADLSVRDDLTGLFNRRATEQVLERAESAFREEAVDYAAVVLDVDKFKSINDRYGHHAGDSTLKSLAVCILENIRSADYAFRTGGDEFMVVLPGVDATSVLRICARIEEALRELHGFAFPIRVSVGYALRSERPSSAAVLELADQRMYIAKRAPGDGAFDGDTRIEA